VSSLLADMLRKSRSAYNDMWTERTRTGFATEPNGEVISRHLSYWDTIVTAVETNEFGELMQNARDAGRYQATMGLELSDAVNRTVSATNMIEIALLESNDGEASPIDVIGEVADLRSMIVMAVVDGYKSATETAPKKEKSTDRLRAALLREPEKFKPIDLAAGDELGPLYDADLRFYAVASGKIRLYNLLSNGRTITLSILSENDVFFQWKAQSASLSVVCAEAMQDSRIVGVSESDLVQLLGSQPAAAIDVIQNFARRLTESQALIDDLMNNSVNLLLYRTLAELARQFGRDAGGTRAGAVIIDVPLTHQRLADMIGSNRVTVTRKLHELQQRGLIVARGSGSIEVTDLPALTRLVANAEP
jgi:CRP/FNR family transcriptional regulator